VSAKSPSSDDRTILDTSIEATSDAINSWASHGSPRTCHTSVCHNVSSCQVLVERSDDQIVVNSCSVALEGIVLYAIVLLLMRLPVRT
jgi:hypothetical protein